MNSSLKKSLYLGLAAVSFASVAAVSTTASAKSYATAGAYTSLEKADATKRNVEATGTNAIYTKPGTVKGAKVVASKATMAKLASSKKSADYFRAYGVKTTNRGSVYYKVVTMNGKYRGYVYGGKDDTTFAGGIKSADTTVDKTSTDTMVGKTVYFANPGKTNVTWTAPNYTQYKASKNVVSTQPFSGDTLKVTKAATKTREGSLYYYVEDQNHPSVSGWIYSKAVTTDQKVAFDETSNVKVNFVNDKGVTVASDILKDLAADDNSGTAKTKGTAVGTAVSAKKTDFQGVLDAAANGYTYTNTNANQAILLGAKTGDTLNVSVTENASVTTPLTLAVGNSSATAQDSYTLTADKDGSAEADAKTVVVPSLSAGFKGPKDAAFTAATLKAFGDANLSTLYTKTYKGDNDTTTANTYTKYTLSGAQDGVYGKNATLVYTAQVMTGKSPADDKGTVDTGNIFA